MKKISTILLLCVLFVSPVLNAQQPQDDKPRKWLMRGYVKSLQTVLINDLDNILTDHLLHNRLNFKWYPNDHFTFVAEARNRIFYGEVVRTFPNYSDFIDDQANDVVDLSIVPVDKSSLVLHSVIDRLYLDFVKNDWEVRLGRQRINWGINLAFNPNDLFNTFSFFDVDYTERPGSDALRVQYYLDYASSLEIAVKAFENKEEIVAAGMYKFNKWNYDFQLLSGVFEQDVVIGLGWAGNLKNAGFKGEMSYFHPFANSEIREKVLATALSVDISVKDWFIVASIFFNSNGETANVASNPLLVFSPSPKSLYPYKVAIISQASYTISPLTAASLAAIYSPGSDHALFLNPSIGISLAQDWDLNLISQLFFSKSGDQFLAGTKAVYASLNWSFSSK